MRTVVVLMLLVFCFYPFPAQSATVPTGSTITLTLPLDSNPESRRIRILPGERRKLIFTLTVNDVAINPLTTYGNYFLTIKDAYEETLRTVTLTATTSNVYCVTSNADITSLSVKAAVTCTTGTYRVISGYFQLVVPKTTGPEGGTAGTEGTTFLAGNIVADSVDATTGEFDVLIVNGTDLTSAASEAQLAVVSASVTTLRNDTNTSLILKQNAATAATDTELAALRSDANTSLTLRMLLADWWTTSGLLAWLTDLQDVRDDAGTSFAAIVHKHTEATLDIAQNSDTTSGVVQSGAGQASKVWKTNASGLPAWRDDSGVGDGITTDSADLRYLLLDDWWTTDGLLVRHSDYATSDPVTHTDWRTSNPMTVADWDATTKGLMTTDVELQTLRDDTETSLSAKAPAASVAILRSDADTSFGLKQDAATAATDTELATLRSDTETSLSAKAGSTSVTSTVNNLATQIAAVGTSSTTTFNKKANNTELAALASTVLSSFTSASYKHWKNISGFLQPTTATTPVKVPALVVLTTETGNVSYKHYTPLEINFTASPTATAATTYYSGLRSLAHTALLNPKSISLVRGLWGEAYHRSSGTLQTMVGFGGAATNYTTMTGYGSEAINAANTNYGYQGGFTRGLQSYVLNWGGGHPSYSWFTGYSATATGARAYVQNAWGGTIGTAYGAQFSLKNDAVSGGTTTSTMTSAALLYLDLENGSKGYIPTLYGLRIGTPTNTGAIDAFAALKLENMSGVGRNTNWAIHSAGGDSYHAGNLGIGKVPSVALDVNGLGKFTTLYSNDLNGTSFPAKANAANSALTGTGTFATLKGTALYSTDLNGTSFPLKANLAGPTFSGTTTFATAKGTALYSTDLNGTTIPLLATNAAITSAIATSNKKANLAGNNTLTGNLSVNGNATLGDSTADSHIMNGAVSITSGVTGNLLVGGQIYSPTFTTTYATSMTVSWDNGNGTSVTLTNTPSDIVFTNAKSGGDYTLYVTQDGTGTRLLQWNDSGMAVKFPGGVAPVLTTTINALDILRFRSDGTKLYLISFAADVK